ncbi:MAG: MFS transporter, partial [Ancalomicrobiaceae bacterium]|nr:MFS transporter [Ancalomicrobiaceae bacterium]
ATMTSQTSALALADRSGQAAGDARWRIAAIFFINAIAGSTLNIRIPDLQIGAGISDVELGFVLMGQSIGALSVFPFVSRLIEAIGTRSVILVGYLLTVLTGALMTVSSSGLVMFLMLFANGAAGNVAGIAINVEADRVEAQTGSRILSRCHGAWSASFFLFSLAAGLFRSFGLSPTIHLWAIVPIFAVLTVALVVPMSEAPPRQHNGAARQSRFSWPTLAVVALVAFALGSQILEVSARVWATIYLRDAFNVAAIVESSALPALVLTMAIGRLSADRWIDAYGPRRVANLLSAVAFAGLAVVVVAPNAYVAIAGFAIAGLGLGALFPIAVSGAARLGDRSAAANVAAMTLIIQLVMMMAPMLIGAIAQGFGVRAAFGCMLPVLALSWVMARVLDR